MSHTEYQNWIDYDKENFTKKNILEYIDMYEKYTLKRLREIVKHHNKMVRKEAMIMKKKEIKDHVIKVTDYKTKDSLIARMKKSKKYHEQYLLGLREMNPKKLQRINLEIDNVQEQYTSLMKEGKKDDAKQYLNYKAFDISKLSEAFKVDRIDSVSEFKNMIRKQSKKDLKTPKELPKIKGMLGDGQKEFEKIVKSADPKQSKAALKQLIKKLSKPQREKVVKQAKKLKKQPEEVKKIKGKGPLQDVLLGLSKSDNPAQLMEALFKKYNEQPAPAPAPAPAPKKEQPKAKPAAKPEPKIDFKKEFKKLAEKKIDEVHYKIDNDDQFGKDFKKFNLSRKRIFDYVMDNAIHKKQVSKSKLQEQYDENILPLIIKLAEKYISKFDVKEVHVMPNGVIMKNKKMKGGKKKESKK